MYQLNAIKLPSIHHPGQNHRSHPIVRSWHRTACGVGLVFWVTLNLGCVSPWWNSFLAPQELGNFQENRVTEIQRSISFRDKPMVLAGAVEPSPEDLIADVQEYTLGPGDVVAINLMDFLQVGMETPLTVVVDEIGYIHVPQLGWLYVEGLTARQLQAEVIRRSVDAGIYPPDTDPIVVVQLLARQHRMFNISGTIAAPGPYGIIRPDFRLREAINQAGGLPDAVKYIYVFRHEPQERRIQPARPITEERRPTEPTDQPDVPPPPPVAPWSMAEMSTNPSPPAPPVQPPPPPAVREQDPPELFVPSEEAEAAEQELMDALAPDVPPGTLLTPGPATLPTAPEPATAPEMPTYIYMNGQFIEAPTERPTVSPPADPPPTAVQPPPPRPDEEIAEPVDWEALAMGGQQRVLIIPASKIREGDPSYNVVIRPMDWIELDPGPVGVFYLDGHVMRPGVYSLAGQEMTLTQAIAAAGGLDQVAWPTRCEIRRRIEGDREEITQWDLARIVDGRDPDLFIKEGDVIRVGTHAVAPLLAMIRNSFRLTYGFGFVYDRNFADIDAYQAQQNPRDRRRNERRQLGLR